MSLLGIASIVKTDANNSDRSVADTIKLMNVHVNNAVHSIQIHKAIEQAGVASNDSDDSKCEKIFRFIKSKVQFVQDEDILSTSNINPHERGQELLITPPYLLSMEEPKGDCDDFSMLCCSMLLATGIKCGFVTVAADESLPNQFTHVYCVAYTDRGRVYLDCSHGRDLGWETPRAHRKKEWPIISLQGLGMLISKNNYARDWASQFRKNFQSGISGLGDCGDCLDYADDGSCITTDTSDCGSAPVGGGVMTGPLPTASQVATMNTGSSGSSSTTSSFTTALDNLLPGIFGAAEKIAVQGSQQAGVQTQTCNAQGVCTTSSTVLPSGYTGSLSIPGITGSTSLTSLLPILLIGGLAIMFLEKN